LPSFVPLGTMRGASRQVPSHHGKARMNRLSRMAVAAIAAAAETSTVVAVTTEDFAIRNAQDLVDLCGVAASDPNAAAAIHFCHGYGLGVVQYHDAIAAGPRGVRLFCPTEPRPSRDAVVGLFIDWAKRNPQRMGEPAIDAVIRFATETWPCTTTRTKAKAK